MRIVALACCTLLGVAAPAAWAHDEVASYLNVDRTADGRLDLRWRIARADLPARADPATLLRSTLRLTRADGAACVVDPAAPAADGEGFVLLRASVRCEGGGATAAPVLRYLPGPEFGAPPRLLVRVGDAEPRLLAVDTTLALPGAAGERAEVEPSSFGGFVRAGVGHILGGIDHLLFLLMLLLPAGLERHDRQWRPRQDRWRALRQVAWIVTAFTAAHSIALALATFGWLRIDSGTIEPLVAATVLATALNNLWPVAIARRALLAFGFGLIHGCAFAEVLVPLHLPAPQLALALLGFNLGVEFGQLAVVTATFVALTVAASWRGYPHWVLGGGSAATAVVACVWLVERIREAGTAG